MPRFSGTLTFVQRNSTFGNGVTLQRISGTFGNPNSDGHYEVLLSSVNGGRSGVNSRPIQSLFSTLRLVRLALANYPMQLTARLGTRLAASAPPHISPK